MKNFIMIILFLITVNSILGQSVIDLGEGTIVEVSSGAEICADIQSGNGMLTGNGTWCSEVLPVEMQSFTANVDGNSVALKWATTSEVNNSGFVVQRSADERVTWSSIGYVNGVGNSTQLKEYTFTDKNLAPGSYAYRLKQSDYNGRHEYFELEGSVRIGVPEKFCLYQNYPNPFNPATTITFDISVEAAVDLSIFDMSGREVMSLISYETRSPGRHRVEFDAGDLSSGTYMYRLTAKGGNANFSAVKKMVLMK